MMYLNTIDKNTPIILDGLLSYGSVSSKEADVFCVTETTDGTALYEKTTMINQKSCMPNVFNAGNYYSFPGAATTTTEPAIDSICAKGWSLPRGNNNTDYASLLSVYNNKNVSNLSSAMLSLPLSFLRAGNYDSDGELFRRGSVSYNRMSAKILYFDTGTLSTKYDTNPNRGFSVRCVSR